MRLADKLVWSDDPVYTGTQTMTVMPVLSEAEIEELIEELRLAGNRVQTAGGFNVPSVFGFGKKIKVTHTDDVLTGDSLDMVEKAWAAARG